MGYFGPSRQEKTLIGAHFDPDVKREPKIIAAQEDISIQALLEEAIANLKRERHNTLKST